MATSHANGHLKVWIELTLILRKYFELKIRKKTQNIKLIRKLIEHKKLVKYGPAKDCYA